MKSVVPTRSGSTGLIPNKYYIASVLLAHTNGLNKMNMYKLEWMEHAQLLHDNIKVTTDSNGNIRFEQSMAFRDATQKTGRAVAAGVALAAIDGPLPFMDVLGFGVTTTLAAIAWYEFFTTT